MFDVSLKIIFGVQMMSGLVIVVLGRVDGKRRRLEGVRGRRGRALASQAVELVIEQSILGQLLEKN